VQAGGSGKGPNDLQVVEGPMNSQTQSPPIRAIHPHPSPAEMSSDEASRGLLMPAGSESSGGVQGSYVDEERKEQAAAVGTTRNPQPPSATDAAKNSYAAASSEEHAGDDSPISMPPREHSVKAGQQGTGTGTWAATAALDTQAQALGEPQHRRIMRSPSLSSTKFHTDGGVRSFDIDRSGSGKHGDRGGGGSGSGIVQGVHAERRPRTVSSVHASGTGTGTGTGEEASSESGKHAVSASVKQLVERVVHQPVHKYEWNEEHTKVFRNGGHLEENWLPEFLDLILVAAMLKLGDGLHICGLNHLEFFYTGMEFLLLFNTRYMIDEFWWHFYLDDLWNQFLFMLYIVGVFLIALMVSYSESSLPIISGSAAPHRHLAATDGASNGCIVDDFHLVGFFTGILVTRSVLTIFWLVELYFDKAARGSFYMHPTRNIITICISIAGIVLNNAAPLDVWSREDSVYLMVGIVLNEYYLAFYKCIHTEPLIQLNEIWPLSLLDIQSKDHAHEVLFECDEELEAVQTRMGLFILIVLGEGVIQLLLPSFDVRDIRMREGVLLVTLMGLLLIWSIAKQFFDAAQRVPSGHALRRCMRSGFQWMVMHALAGMFTFLLGIGLKLLYEDLREQGAAHQVLQSHQIALAAGAAGSVFCFTYMRFLHKGLMVWPANRGRLGAYLLRFCIAFLHFTVIWWEGVHRNDARYIVLIHLLIAASLNSLDLYNFQPLHRVEGADEFERKWRDFNGEDDDERLDITPLIGQAISEVIPSNADGESKAEGGDRDNITISGGHKLSSSNFFAAFDIAASRKVRANKRGTPTGSSTNLLAGITFNSGSVSRAGSSADILQSIMMDKGGEGTAGGNMVLRKPDGDREGDGGEFITISSSDDVPIHRQP